MIQEFILLAILVLPLWETLHLRLSIAQIFAAVSRKAFEAALFQMFLNAVLTLTLNGHP